MEIVRLLTSFLLVGTFLASGCTPGTTSSKFTIPSVSGGEVSNPKLAMAILYETAELSISPDSPCYILPLDLEGITNYGEIESGFRLTENQKRLLEENGFVVIPRHGDDIVQPYKTLKEQGVPIFVTSDTLLHLYHIQFNEILKRLSQYVPRGHYTGSEALKRYFKAAMWYGRMAFLLKGGPDALVSERDAQIATIQASLISAELPNLSLSADGSNRTTAWEIWNRVYSVTSFFVGTADDLTPYEYLGAIENVFGTEFDAIQLADEEALLSLKAELAQMRNPQIYGGSGVCFIAPPVTKEKLYECLAKTKGMRFMGQRFVPDSYMFQNLVFPAVGMYVGEDEPFTMKMTILGPTRCFPRGLDIMAVLGSERAYDILKADGDTEYRGENTSYDKQLDYLREQFSALTEEDWNRNLYWAWLYALKPLLEDYGQGYPTFMQTEAWTDKELQTVLASWTELRHDTILYAKQSYTPAATAAPPQPKPVVGYVEPVPEFYSRMLALTTMTNEGLNRLNALTAEEKARLESLESILQRLIQISQDELEGKELKETDYEFIRNFGKELDAVITGVEAEGKETTMVADVHTDANPPMEVLEEGVGYIDLVLVAYKVPDGRIIVGAGPTLSYYEFKQPVSERLTDEQWKEILELGEQPPRPSWIDSFYTE